MFFNPEGYARDETFDHFSADLILYPNAGFLKSPTEIMSGYELRSDLTIKPLFQIFHFETISKKAGFKQTSNNYYTGVFGINEVNAIRTSPNFRYYAFPVIYTNAFDPYLLNQVLKSNKETKEFYLHKAKNKNTTGKILLLGGTAMVVVGLIGVNDNFTFGSFSLFGPPVDQAKSAKEIRLEIYTIMALTGIVADLVSIPFFISAHHNKKMASKISLGNLNIYSPPMNSYSLDAIPALTIKVNF